MMVTDRDDFPNTALWTLRGKDRVLKASYGTSDSSPLAKTAVKW
jgi:hypothetical protein